MFFSFSTLPRFIDKTQENERIENYDFLKTSISLSSLLGQLDIHKTLTWHACITEERTTYHQLSIQNATILQAKECLILILLLLFSSFYLFHSLSLILLFERSLIHTSQLTGSSLLPGATYICWLYVNRDDSNVLHIEERRKGMNRFFQSPTMSVSSFFSFRPRLSLCHVHTQYNKCPATHARTHTDHYRSIHLCKIVFKSHW